PASSHAPGFTPAGNGDSPASGTPDGLLGFIGKSNTRFVAGTGLPFGSIPPGVSRSTPASTALPSVVFVPSVIQPLLLNVYGASLPIRVTSVLLIRAPCAPFSDIGPGESGFGLSATGIIAFGFA